MSWLGLSVLLGLGLTSLCIRRPNWGVYILAAALPLERIGSWALNPDTGHPVVRFSQIAGFALVLAFVIRVTWGKSQLRRPPAALAPLGLFVLSALISLLVVGPAVFNGWVALMYLAGLVYVLYCLAPGIIWPRLANVLLVSGGGVSLFGLYQFVAGAAGLSPAWTGLREAYAREVFGFPRVQSTALEPLYFANYLIIPLTVGFALLLAGHLHRWWQRAALGLMGLVFGLTMSRGAFIALAAAGPGGLVWLFVTVNGRATLAAHWRRLGLGLAGAALAGLGLVGTATYLSTGDFWKGPKFFMSMVTTELTATKSFSERAAMRQTAWDIYQANPMWGVGISGISPYLQGYPEERQPDDTVALNNQFLELLAETGLMGAGLFYSFLATLLAGAIVAWRRATDETRPWLFGLAVAVVALTIQAQSFSGFLLTHFWVCYGWLAGLSSLPAKRRSRRPWRYIIDARRAQPELVQELDRQAGTLDICLLLNPEQAADLPKLQLRTSVLPQEFPPYGRLEQFDLVRQLAKLRPDAVHFMHQAAPVLWWGRRLTTIQPELSLLGRTRWWDRFLVAVAARRSVHLMADSPEQAHDLITRYGVRTQQITIMHTEPAEAARQILASYETIRRRA